jgi:hypothetical protein
VFPSEQIYAGVYTGGATGKVTVSVMDATNVTWSSASSSVATVSGNSTLGTAVGVAAGSTTIDITADGTQFSIPLLAISYTSAQLSAGQSAFQTVNCATLARRQ